MLHESPEVCLAYCPVSLVTIVAIQGAGKRQAPSTWTQGANTRLESPQPPSSPRKPCRVRTVTECCPPLQCQAVVPWEDP